MWSVQAKACGTAILTNFAIAVLVQQDIAGLQVEVQDRVGLHVVQVVQPCSSAAHRIIPGLK